MRVNLDMPYLIDMFKRDYSYKVNRGEVSSLTALERSMLNYFCEWAVCKGFTVTRDCELNGHCFMQCSCNTLPNEHQECVFCGMYEP